MTSIPIAHRADDGAAPGVRDLELRGRVTCTRCGRLVISGKFTLTQFLDAEQTHLRDWHAGRLSPRELREKYGVASPPVRGLRSRDPGWWG